MLRHSAWLVLLLSTTAATAGELRHASVAYRDGIYMLDLDVIVAARAEPVLALVTDYDRLYRISKILVETRLISAPDAAVKRRLMVIRACILIFCFTTNMVEDVWEDKEGTIITRIVPAQSDYLYGRTEWHVNAVDAGHSHIQLLSELKPDFWIPPFIGPFLMKQKMMNEAKKTVYRIEKLAGDG